MTNEIIIRHMEYDDFYIDRTGESLYSTGSITIDWGDGTIETTNNNTYSYSHNYHDYAGYITVTISGVEEIRDGFLSIESYGGQYVDAVTIPNNITSIGNNFCYNQEHLHYLTLSNSLTTIGDDFCYGCYLSNGLELPDSLTSIGNNFCNVTGYLDTLTLPDNITTIGDNFCADSGLTSFTIPNSIVSIGDYFLSGCSLLTGDMVIPNSVESIGNDFLNWCGITSIIFENNSAIDGIPDNFAYECMNLTNISFPDNLENIGANFCCNCPSLTRVEFPEGLIEIGENFLTGDEELIHLNKLIFPSSFRYLNYGLSGSSVDKVIFKSVIPVDMSAGYPDQFDSMIIYVPKNCTDAYANAFTEAFGDYGEDSLSDPNHYRENLTLPETAAKFGTLMRTNLKRKGIETQRNNGLTTLINKVNNIETNDMTGFLADIGFYDANNWSGTPPTILKDKLIFNDDSAFSFVNIDFPDTFVWSFIISFKDSDDSFSFNEFSNGTIQPKDYVGSEGHIEFEELVTISRENGGEFTLELDKYEGQFGIDDLSEYYLSFTPANDPIVIKDICFGEETLEYESVNYKAMWDRYSSSKPLTMPVCLLKDNKIINEYSLNENTDNLEFVDRTDVPSDISVWGFSHYKDINDDSDYSWLNPKEYGYPLDLTEDNYNLITHSMDNGAYRVDHLVPYPINGCESFPTSDYTCDSNSNTYQINGHMNYNWGLTFEYHEKEEISGKFYIGFVVASAPLNILNVLRFALIGETLRVSYGNYYVDLSDMEYSPDMIFKIYQEYDETTTTYLFTIEVNGQKHTIETGGDFNMVTKFRFENLVTISYDENCELTKFYYWNIEEVQS